MAKRRPPPRPRATQSSLSPPRILRQIFILQLTYYLSIIILTLFTTLVSGQPFSLSLIFASSYAIRTDNTLGWTLALLWLLSSLVVVAVMMVVLARSKLVLDFALTLHFIHLVITSLCEGGVPGLWEAGGWWVVQFVSAVGMILLGRWACRWRELRPISISVPQGRSADGGSSTRRGEDEEMGEDYEMMPMMGKEVGATGVSGGGGDGVGGGGGGRGVAVV